MKEFKPYAMTVGPYVGMNDTVNLSAQDSDRYAYGENVYSPQVTAGGDAISRPGATRIAFTRSPTSFFGAGRYTLTGTVTITNGSAAVTGVGTKFLTELRANQYITDNALNSAQILSITSDTALTLTGAWTFATYSGTAANGAGYLAQNDSVFTETADALPVGDVVTMGGSTLVLIQRYTANAFQARTGFATPGYTTAATITGAGVTGGKIYHVGQYQNTSGVTRRYVIVSTTSSEIDGAGAGRYRFLSASSEKLRLVEYDPTAASTWIDRTSVSMNAVALDTTKRIYGLSFANYYIISDGTNRPRKIDNTFVLTNLTDGNYAVQGAPTIYYGKLFFIDGSDKATLRWSEENDPDTGYGTGTSDNSWTLRQTSSDTLQACIGTNDALYVFRGNSTTLIYGAANTDFRSAGTLDAVSTTVGTRSPDAVTLGGNSVVFVDQYGRPGRIEPGVGYVSMYDRVQEQLRGAGGTDAQLRAGWARLNPALNTLHIGYRASTSATTNGQMLVYDIRTWECLGLWKYYSSGTTAMDHAYATVWLDANNKPRLLVADGQTTNCAVTYSKTEDDQVVAATDTLAAGEQTVPVIVESQKIGGHVTVQKNWTRADVGYRNVGGYTTTYKVQYRTPYADYGTTAAMNQPAQANTYAKGTVKAQYTLNGTGRWVQLKFTNDTTGNPTARFTLDTVTVSGSLDSDDIQAR